MVSQRWLLLAGAVLIAGSLPAATVHASPWTLPQGRIVVGLGYAHTYANSEFFGLDGEPRAERRFPLRGQLNASRINFGVRLGLLDNLELRLAVPFAIVSYQSDNVLLLSQPAGSEESSLDFYQRNIIQLSRDAVGIGDIFFSALYQWINWPVAISTELRLKTPTGYESPAGTFGRQPRSIEEFSDNVGEFVAPGNVTDDVTIGDGQVDLALINHFGVGFDTGTFVRAEVGYNLRFDAGHQLLVGLRAGQLIEGRVLLYAGGDLAMSVTEGPIIGVSVAAIDPEVPAEEYGGLNNLLLREIRLQNDRVSVTGGVIVRIERFIELNIAYSRVVWGRNTSASNDVSVSLGVQTDYLPQPDPASEPVAAEEPSE